MVGHFFYFQFKIKKWRGLKGVSTSKMKHILHLVEVQTMQELARISPGQKWLSGILVFPKLKKKHLWITEASVLSFYPAFFSVILFCLNLKIVIGPNIISYHSKPLF